MNRLFASLSLVLTLFLISTLESCDRDLPLGTARNQDCRIETVIEIGSTSNDTVKFRYDDFGNPVRVDMSFPRTGHPNYVLKYDRLQRLKECAEVFYHNDQFERWHKYGHDAAGRIVADTLFLFGAYNHGRFVSTFVFKQLVRFGYDLSGRIIRKETTMLYPPSPGVSIRTFTYDARGNLGLTGVVYDDKRNFRQTHPVWMFLDENYSRNNPIPATFYNPGFPLSFRIDPLAFPHYFLAMKINQSDFRYSCPYPEVVTMP